MCSNKITVEMFSKCIKTLNYVKCKFEHHEDSIFYDPAVERTESKNSQTKQLMKQ